MTLVAWRARVAAGSFATFAQTVVRHGLPRRLLAFTGGIGDDLLCSAVLREWRRRGAQGVWMQTRYPELFANNPDRDALLPVNTQIARLARVAGARVFRPQYAHYEPAEDRDVVGNDHLIAAICAQAGIRGEVALQPYIQLTSAEQKNGHHGPRQIVIQSSGMAARYPMRNKEWFPERMQTVADALRGKHTLVQIGATTDPVLHGAIDMRGRTSLRETAAILAESMLFIGLAGFPMHLARAVECRSVIVYGGREHPAQSGYSCNENVYNQVPCAPCWKKNECPFERRCMHEITPDLVLAAVERALARHGEPLVVDIAEI